jgi:hypothetical protein
VSAASSTAAQGLASGHGRAQLPLMLGGVSCNAVKCSNAASCRMPYPTAESDSTLMSCSAPLLEELCEGQGDWCPWYSMCRQIIPSFAIAVSDCLCCLRCPLRMPLPELLVSWVSNLAQLLTEAVCWLSRPKMALVTWMEKKEVMGIQVICSPLRLQLDMQLLIIHGLVHVSSVPGQSEYTCCKLVSRAA